MGLSDSRVSAVIAVTDMARAKDFYENKLGLVGGQDQPDGGVRYPCGDTELHVYPSQYAGGSGATIAGWTVDDIDAAVDELTAKGVAVRRPVEHPTRRASPGRVTSRARGSRTPTGTSCPSARDSPLTCPEPVEGPALWTYSGTQTRRAWGRTSATGCRS